MDEKMKEISAKVNQLFEQLTKQGSDRKIIAEQISQLLVNVAEEIEKNRQSENKQEIVVADTKKKEIQVAGRQSQETSSQQENRVDTPDEEADKEEKEEQISGEFNSFTRADIEKTDIGRKILDAMKTKKEDIMDAVKHIRGLKKSDLAFVLIALGAVYANPILTKYVTEQTKEQPEIIDTDKREDETIATVQETETTLENFEMDGSTFLEVYKEHVASQDIEFRSDSSSDTDKATNKILSEGATIYLHEGDEIDIEETGESLTKAIYMNTETGKYETGYVDPSLLTEKESAEIVALTDGEKEMILDGPMEGNISFIKYKPYTVNSAAIDLRAEPSVDTGEVMDILDNDQKVYVLENTTPLNMNDNITWRQAMYYDAVAGKYEVGYVDLKHLAEPSKVIYGYKDPGITDEDIEKFLNCTNSWENPDLYKYMNGSSTNYSQYISKFVTEDRKYYICQTDLRYDRESDRYVPLNNGTKNYGFGVLVQLYGDYNNSDLFQEEGYDIEDPKCLKLNKSQIPVEVVDNVARKYANRTIETIKECLQEKNIYFSKKEVLGLAAICYQFGKEDYWIRRFISEYEKYGGNTEEFRKNFYSKDKDGTRVFVKVLGGNTIYNGNYFYRSDFYWKAFHEGVFVTCSIPAKEYIIKDEEERTTTQDKIEQKTVEATPVQETTTPTQTTTTQTEKQTTAEQQTTISETTTEEETLPPPDYSVLTAVKDDRER